MLSNFKRCKKKDEKIYGSVKKLLAQIIVAKQGKNVFSKNFVLVLTRTMPTSFISVDYKGNKQ